MSRSEILGGIQTFNDALTRGLVPDMSVIPLPFLNETHSQYFSPNGQYPVNYGGSKSQQQINTMFEESQGAGYNSFFQHVMQTDGASTPLNHNFQVSTPVESAASTRLVFGKSPDSQKVIRKPLRKHTPKSAELRIKPGQSDLLVQGVLQNNVENQNVSTKRRAVQSTPTKGRPRPPPQIRLAGVNFTSNFTTETTILRRAEANRPGLKQIKLRDNFEVLEFVDLILDNKTTYWDIEKDQATNKNKVVVNQLFE